ncbi:MAG: hypothetical protein F4119_04880 [Acidimicrobiia bacterium]|nr:hypothetical protein [Acidimicrobiia bacterium]
MASDNIGDRIRSLFSQAPTRVTVIAPFIKVNALKSLLEILPDATYLRCVTRWLPHDIAQGVSDLEVLDLIEDRGNGTLTLVDKLHAKIYIADEMCLVGSANVTLSGFGDYETANIEVLVETTLDDVGVAATLDEISKSERLATKEFAEAVRQGAEILSSQRVHNVAQLGWIPLSFKPELAFTLYSQFQTANMPDLLVESNRIVLEDLYRADITPENSTSVFTAMIREKLALIPAVKTFLEGTSDELLTFNDMYEYFSQFNFEDHSENDLWRAFVNWMVYFYPDRVMKHEIIEVALRRARRII